MKHQSMLAKMKSFFHPASPTSEERQEAWARLHNKTKKSLQATNPAEFENRLNDILGRFTMVSTGHVQLLDFDNVKKSLGDFFEARKDHVLKIVTSSIERRLTSHDVYTKFGESGYVIVFAQLGEKEAQLKSQLMADEIATRLLGKACDKHVVEVKTAVAKEDGKILFKKTPTIDTLVSEIKNAHSTTKAAPEKIDVLKDLQFIFRPMWFVKSRVISTFLCIPIVNVSKNSYMSGYSFLSEGNDTENIFKLDLATLQKVAAELEAMSLVKKVALMSLPVHFETLGSKKQRMEYIQKCSEILIKFKDKVIFEIVGLPEGVPDTRLLEFFSALNPFSRSILARFDLEHTNFLGYRTSGIHAVGVDVFDNQLSEKVIMNRMEKFVDAADKASLKTYIHGLKTISLNTAAITSGFDYVDGYAVTSASEAVDGAYRLEMEEIYSSV